jgi:hypothetical protein
VDLLPPAVIVIQASFFFLPGLDPYRPGMMVLCLLSHSGQFP